jgi:hypothetical protein
MGRRTDLVQRAPVVGHPGKAIRQRTLNQLDAPDGNCAYRLLYEIDFDGGQR